MTGLMGLIPGLGQAKLAGVAIGAGVTFIVGFAAAEMYEHKVPWGLGPKYHHLKDSLPARDAERFTAGGHAQFARDNGVLASSWIPALRACRAQRVDISTDAAARLDQELAAGRTSSNAAYALGLASCKGKTNAKTGTATRPAATGSVLDNGDTDLGDIVRSSSGTSR